MTEHSSQCSASVGQKQHFDMTSAQTQQTNNINTWRINSPGCLGAGMRGRAGGLGYGSEHCSVQLVSAPWLGCRCVADKCRTAVHVDTLHPV